MVITIQRKKVKVSYGRSIAHNVHKCILRYICICNNKKLNIAQTVIFHIQPIGMYGGDYELEKFVWLYTAVCGYF